MSKPKIYFDFDDTLFQTKPAILEYLVDTYKVNLDPTLWYCGNSFNQIINEKTGLDIPKEKFWSDYAKDFLCSFHRHKHILPLPGMLETMEELAAHYDIFIVTARQKSSKPVIEYLIKKYLKNYIQHTHFVWEKRRNGTFRAFHKHKYVEKHRGEKIAFIDDNPGEIKRMAPVVPSYLFDPHNLHPHSSFERISSWEKIGEKFLVLTEN